MDQQIRHSELNKVRANGIEIACDTFGDPAAPPLLLIAGLGQQMIGWEEDFCSQLASRGFWVIRYDNRDVGLSTRFDEAGVPNILALVQDVALGKDAQVPYLLHDMADDAAGLLDALSIETAHIVGISMGGMIAQEFAIHYPKRVRTLTSIMSTTGDPSLPQARPEAMAVLLTPAPGDRQAYLEHSVQAWQTLNGPGIPLDVERTKVLAGQAFDRGLSPAGTARQLAAVVASGSRQQALEKLAVKTLVIHGDADPLVPVEGGIATAKAIPGAEIILIKDMGHNLPLPVQAQVIEAIARHAG